MTVIALVHSHHLLDHKPDNLLLKGAKFKLSGMACLGRPGVALCYANNMLDVENFVSFLQNAMPQKKFDIIMLDGTENTDGTVKDDFVSGSLGELRVLLAQMGHEDHFFALTGIDPSQATSTSSGNNSKGGGKGGKSSGNKSKGKKKK